MMLMIMQTNLAKMKLKLLFPLLFIIFLRTLNMPLINCEIELTLTWSKNCLLADMTVRVAGNNDKNFLEQLKSGFKKAVKWNKYRSQMTIQSNKNNLNYLVDLIFTKFSRLFILLFERIEEHAVKKIIEILFHITIYQISK